MGIRYGNMFKVMESCHTDLEDITLSHQGAQVLSKKHWKLLMTVVNCNPTEYLSANTYYLYPVINNCDILNKFLLVRYA